MKVKIFSLIFFLALLFSFSFSYQTDCGIKITCLGESETACQISQGKAGAIIISFSNTIFHLEGKLFSRPVIFKSEPEGKIFYALLGADLEQAPGRYLLKIKITRKSGKMKKLFIPIEIKRKAYPVEYLTLPAEMVEFPKEIAMRVIKDNQTILSRIQTEPEVFWEGGFILPVPGKVTSPFGARRIINHKPKSPHSGVDLRAGVGEEVRASNSGKVALVYEGYLFGKTVLLDHGGGIYTLYCHLSQPLVKNGEMVKKGEVIALSGATGRASGPHLHFGAKLLDARIDPLSLIQVSKELEEELAKYQNSARASGF